MDTSKENREGRKTKVKSEVGVYGVPDGDLGLFRWHWQVISSNSKV